MTTPKGSTVEEDPACCELTNPDDEVLVVAGVAVQGLPSSNVPGERLVDSAGERSYGLFVLMMAVDRIENQPAPVQVLDWI